MGRMRKVDHLSEQRACYRDLMGLQPEDRTDGQVVFLFKSCSMEQPHRSTIDMSYQAEGFVAQFNIALCRN